MLQNRYSPLFRLLLVLPIMLTLFLCTCTGQAHTPSHVHSPDHVPSSRQASLMASQVIHYVGGRKPYVLLTPAAALPYYLQDQDKMPTSFDHFSLQTPKGTVTVYWKIDAVLEDGTVLVRTGPHAASSEAMEPQVTHIAFISPDSLPIVLEVLQPYNDGWVHVNGHRLSFFKPQLGGHQLSYYQIQPAPKNLAAPNNFGAERIKLYGGFNFLQVGVEYAE